MSTKALILVSKSDVYALFSEILVPNGDTTLMRMMCSLEALEEVLEGAITLEQAMRVAKPLYTTPQQVQQVAREQAETIEYSLLLKACEK